VSIDTTSRAVRLHGRPFVSICLALLAGRREHFALFLQGKTD
jgi:hypothetical protein